jgi:GMP synthase PP-ATPase subunit
MRELVGRAVRERTQLLRQAEKIAESSVKALAGQRLYTSFACLLLVRL